METVASGATSDVSVTSEQPHESSSAESSQQAAEFMTYEECRQILAQHHPDVELNRHASKLWGALCRLAKAKRVCLEGRCTVCGSNLAQPGTQQDGRTHITTSCHHYSTRHGWRRAEITRASILDNADAIMSIRHQTIGARIKANFALLLDGIDPQ